MVSRSEHVRKEFTLDHQSFNSLTRQAAAGLSPRRSLLTLGAAGLAAGFATPFAADAKNKKGKKKSKNKRQCRTEDLCAPQVGPCTDFLTILCNGDPSCLDSLACCSELGTCDVGGFLACLTNSQLN
jgi:hypothetical protein